MKKLGKFDVKLLTLFCPGVFAIKPNFLINCISIMLYTIVIGLFLKLLSVEKVLLANKYSIF